MYLNVDNSRHFTLVITKLIFYNYLEFLIKHLIAKDHKYVNVSYISQCCKNLNSKYHKV